MAKHPEDEVFRASGMVCCRRCKKEWDYGEAYPPSCIPDSEYFHRIGHSLGIGLGVMCALAAAVVWLMLTVSFVFYYKQEMPKICSAYEELSK